MQFAVDHDYHLHSNLSRCSRCPEQTPERILQYARENDLKTIVLTDHFWDCDVPSEKKFYEYQNFEHITQSLPLPQEEGIRFLFGGETDMDQNGVLGIRPEHYDALSLIVVPTTHFHFFVSKTAPVQERVEQFFFRFDALLAADLPFEKVGLAHITCNLIAPSREEYMQVISQLPEAELRRRFDRTARLGMGVELNFPVFGLTEEEQEIMLRPYLLAKDCGCKFYLGSDAHNTDDLNRVMKKFHWYVEALELKESDKFSI